MICRHHRHHPQQQQQQHHHPNHRDRHHHRHHHHHHSNGFKMRQQRPKMPQDSSKIAPTCPQHAPAFGPTQ
eukprot:3583994-Karenia_brevis.AAC.1